MRLSRERMLDRFLARDASYDGRFWTGVLTTGIYCLPSCTARNPRPENVRFFATRESARAAGLRACLRCRPDAFDPARDPELDEAALVESLVDEVAAAPGDVPDVAALAARAGVGVTKLNALIRRHRHESAAALLQRLRVEAVKDELHARPRRRVLDVALDAGFESSSAFHEAFRRRTSLSPRAWRALASGDRFTLELPDGFRHAAALAAFGRDPASPCEQVDGRTAVKALRLDGRSASLVLRVAARTVRCSVETSGAAPRPGALIAAHDVARRVLGLATDPSPFERRMARSPEHRRLLRGRAGLRVPLTADAWEGLVWTILGQQVSLAFAFQCRDALLARCGFRLAGGRRAHPTPERVADVPLDDLLALRLSGRKAEYLHDVAGRIVDGELDLADLASRSAVRAERELLSVRGLGPWSVGYLLMRAFGLGDCVPVGDSALTGALRDFHGLSARPDADDTRRLMAPFAPDRSLATFHFWQWAAERRSGTTSRGRPPSVEPAATPAQERSP